MKISESQLSTLKKYISLFYSTGLGENDYTPSIVTLVSVSDKNNGWDSSGTVVVETISNGFITQDEIKASSVLGKVQTFKFNKRNLTSEYNEFLLNLELVVSQCNQNLTDLQTPNLFKCYARKTKTFIATSKRDEKRTIKYIKNILSNL